MTMPDTKIDIAEMRERATGGGSFMACRHPDIDHGARSSDLQDRQCVLDYGAPESCDQSAPPHGTVTDKTACPYWALLPHAEPAGASAEELLSLLDRLEQSQREVERLKAERDDALEIALNFTQVERFTASQARVAELTAEVERRDLIERLAAETLRDCMAERASLAALVARLRGVGERIRQQIPATRGCLIQNGIDPHFADVLLSHYGDFVQALQEGE